MVDDNSEYGPKEGQGALFLPAQPVYRERLLPHEQLGRYAGWLAYHASKNPNYDLKGGRVVGDSPDSGLVEKLSEE